MPRVVEGSSKSKAAVSRQAQLRREFISEGSAAVDPARADVEPEPEPEPQPEVKVDPEPEVSAASDNSVPRPHPVGEQSHKEHHQPVVDGAPPAAAPTPRSRQPLPASAISDAQRGAGLIGRLRAVQHRPGSARSALGDSVVVERPMTDTIERDRGDVGDSSVAETLERARIHGIEVLHGYRFDPHMTIDHLVLGTNGIWVVKNGPAIETPIGRMDLGDWFTSDPRLFVGEEDRSDLLEEARLNAEAVRNTLSATRNADIPIRPAVCFPETPPGSATEPFTVGGVLVTWRNRVTEMMLEPVLIDQGTRHELVEFLLAVRYRS